MSNSDLIRKHFSAYEHKGHGHGLHHRGNKTKELEIYFDVAPKQLV